MNAASAADSTESEAEARVFGHPIPGSSEEATPPASLVDRYLQVRGRTRSLCEGLTPEDCQIQSMDDVSPAKWHLAHTSWFFETFVLEPSEGYDVFHPEFRVLFNSYYNAVGEQYPRPRRGLLSRPDLETVWKYREHVDAHVERRLRAGGLSADAAAVIELGCQHEQQHQELLLMDIKHVLSCNPLRPAYRATGQRPDLPAPALRWLRFEASMRHIGHGAPGFAFDNESPRHRVWLDEFEVASRLVTNGEYLEFVRDNGYATPELWLSDGWSLVQRERWQSPLYWERRDGEWHEMTLGGLRPLQENAPVCHVSLYEADAYATWKGARLPLEAEWEVAAGDRAVSPSDNFVESGLLQPAPALESDARQAETRRDALQMLGDAWEWTRQAYSPYPGFRPAAGALGEYNGKFMCNQMVLRGGSCVTPADHIRPTYRNFFYPHQRWQVGGIRLARDVR